MNQKRLPIIVGIVAVVLVLLVALLLVMPKRKEVAAAKGQLEQAQAQQVQLEVHLAQLQESKANAQETRRALDKAATQVPVTADEPGLIRMLQGASDAAGVDMTTQSISPPSEPRAGEGSGKLATLAVNVNVSGNFFQLDEYLFKLENLPRIMKVTSISIRPTEYPTLAMTLSAEAYTSVSSAPEG